jgi:hypothetical protein
MPGTPSSFCKHVPVGVKVSLQAKFTDVEFITVITFIYCVEPYLCNSTQREVFRTNCKINFTLLNHKLLSRLFYDITSMKLRRLYRGHIAFWQNIQSQCKTQLTALRGNLFLSRFFSSYCTLKGAFYAKSKRMLGGRHRSHISSSNSLSFSNLILLQIHSISFCDMWK